MTTFMLISFILLGALTIGMAIAVRFIAFELNVVRERFSKIQKDVMDSMQER